MLGFQAECGSFLIRKAAFSELGAVEEIARVELDAGLGSEDFEDAATDGFADFCGWGERATIAIENEIVIVTDAVAELLVIVIDARANGAGGGEIERRIGDRLNLSSGNEQVINRRIAIGVDHNFMIEY